MLAPFTLAIEHQRDVVDRAEQQPVHKAAEPPIYRLLGRKVDRQHPPATARPGKLARNASSTSRRSVFGLRPGFGTGCRNGCMNRRSSSVRSVG
ncbi:hypothetical protein HNO88_003708 [Novosphingobium chloroacetimidivorans]|uniref:Uncharacterized protein n=1 Tax=Novosphingobium chloroacetimidivorans TaxID=1428314 RepID=A0A7W7KCL7_9SPHN|nr:hypothetical protein [Novosphingobium chloroacetimidivorans]